MQASETETETETETEMEMEMEIENGIGNWKWSSNIHATSMSIFGNTTCIEILTSSLVLRPFHAVN